MNKKELKSILDNKIDIVAGELLYAHRINLGKIFEESSRGEINDNEVFKKVFLLLHEKEAPIIGNPYLREFCEYLNEVSQGLIYWIEQEKKLKYDPTKQEKQAGIEKLSETLPEFRVVKAIAKDFHVDPDTVYNWQYGKVFGILLTDLEEHRFRKKLQQVYENESKLKNRRHGKQGRIK